MSSPLLPSAPPVVATLPVPANAETTVAMWIKMTQTSAAGTTQWMLRSEYLSVGVVGNSYVVSMRVQEEQPPIDEDEYKSSERSEP